MTDYRQDSGTPLPMLDDAVRCPLLDGNHEEWIRCCTARFMPIARRVAGDDTTAHDALQESWVAVLHGVGKYRGQPPACAWVRAIVRHEAARQAIRRRRDVPLDPERVTTDVRRRRPEPPISEGANPEDKEYRRHLIRLLLEVVNGLPAVYQEIIRMRDIDEQDPGEVAAKLHISRSNVSSRLHRAHALLRRRLLQRLGVRDDVRSAC